MWAYPRRIPRSIWRRTCSTRWTPCVDTYELSPRPPQGRPKAAPPLGEDAAGVFGGTSQRARIAGTLSLSALWHVLAGARLLVCPDTGIAHLGRIIGIPTVTLFGPGSAVICGPGAFFANMPGRAVTVDPFACRDQTIQFFREVA